MEYRILSTPEHLDACIALQKTIWGLDDSGVTSSITLKALSMSAPPVGLVTGAFDGEQLVGFAINMGTMQQGVVYGHMLGVLEEYRDQRTGRHLIEYTLKLLCEQGIREIVITYEPLESRNAHIYLHKCKGRAFSYQQECFHVHCAMHDGLPLDRLLVRMPVGEVEPAPAAEPPVVLKDLPEATPEYMPEAEAVRLRIPGDLAALKMQDMEQARRYRIDTRAVFTEYLNNRGYVAVDLVSENMPEGRVSYYVLSKGNTI